MMPDVMACLKKDLADIHPDFILATGDIASTQTREAMFEARDLMESLGFPYYPMGGNHDFVVRDSRKWFLEAFKDRLPEPSTFYSFDHKDLHFAVLDPWWMWGDGTLSPVSEASVAANLDSTLAGARWAVTPDQLEWLEADLARHADKTTIIASHYPALPVPDRLRSPGFNDSGAIANGDLLLLILESFPQVKAIFSGHVHLNFAQRYNGLVQVTTSSLPEYPVEFRVVDVHPDRLEIHTRGLSDSSFAERSRIPGKEFAAGHAADRDLTIIR
jgi:3',5'-cyclic AMP phosphodiesterase CpdA